MVVKLQLTLKHCELHFLWQQPLQPKCGYTKLKVSYQGKLNTYATFKEYVEPGKLKIDWYKSLVRKKIENYKQKTSKFIY